ncbi:Uncharacterised protein [Chlamydia trachomatis]|nr:Uncharacterised protein [Chlamydia trachomatis]
MSWVRQGDEADMFPMLMDLAQCEGFDHRTMNEVHGFISRASSYSARYKTDYILELGYVHSLLGSETDRIVRMCIEVGLLSRIEVDGRQKLKIVEDPTYIHILSKADSQWRQQQARDCVDPNLKGPVLLRDGDNCRWCGKEVIWPGKASNRKATLDHLKPGEAGTVDTLVVACLTCNTSRQNDDTGSWDSYHKLLPVPPRPHYGRWSQKYLEDHGLRRFEAAPVNEAPAQTVSASTSDTPSVGVLPGLDGAGVSGVGSVDAGRVLADVDPLRGGGLEGVDPLAVDAPGSTNDGSSVCDKRSTGPGTGPLLGQSLANDWSSGAPRTGEYQGRDGKGRVESGSGGVGPGQGQAGSGSGGAGRRRSRKRRRRRKR